MHHCTQEYLLFSLWLQKEPSRLPNYASHKIILQYYLINNKNQVFLIDDKMPIEDVDDSSLIPMMSQKYFKQNYKLNVQPLYVCDLTQSADSNIMITLKCSLQEQDENHENFIKDLRLIPLTNILFTKNLYENNLDLLKFMIKQTKFYYKKEVYFQYEIKNENKIQLLNQKLFIYLQDHMFELNSIQEHLINQTNMMYVDIIHTFKNKNENLEQENQVLKKRCKQLELKLNLSEKSREKGKNQNLYKVSQGSGYYFSLFQRDQNSKKKQEFKILNEKEQTQKVFDLQTSEFQLNQETEKKQKKQREIEKTPPKNIIQQKILQVIDQQKNVLDQQLNNDVKQNKNDQEQTQIDQQIFNISKFNPTQNQISLEQNTDLNQQNEKASQYEQQPLDNNNYIKNDLIVELQEKYQHALIQIQELKNSILQKDKQINELTQQLSQFYKTLPNSNDTTMTIEHIEETQKEQLKKGQYSNQNNQQIEQIQKEELLKELDEERRKNNDLIKNQQMFLQELIKASRSSKNKNTSMNKDSEDEDMDNYDQVIDETKFLKEWKNNLQQLVEEIVEYEENDRNLKQELSSFAELKQKYDELTMYYTEAYNRLGGALQQIDELNQEVENKNSQLQEQQQHITQLEQGMFNHQNQDNQFQENCQNYLQYEQEILQLNQTIQQLQAQLNSIQQQDYYQRMSQILLENEELKKINSENLEDSQKKDQLIEDLQQQLLTQSQLIGNQEFQERNGQQEQQLQDDLQQKPQLQVDFNK